MSGLHPPDFSGFSGIITFNYQTLGHSACSTKIEHGGARGFHHHQRRPFVHHGCRQTLEGFIPRIGTGSPGGGKLPIYGLSQFLSGMILPIVTTRTSKMIRSCGVGWLDIH